MGTSVTGRRATTRNGALDFLKFAFAIIIVLFHGRTMTEDVSEQIFISGHLGVEFYFLVSGCLMAMKSEKEQKETLGRETFSFIKHKFTALTPNIYVAWIIAFIVWHICRSDGGWSVRVLAEHFVRGVPEILLIYMSGILWFAFDGVMWYLSVMLISMLVIYPLMRKYKDIFFYVIAPISVLFCMGFLYQSCDSLNLAGESWNGIMYNAMLRGFAELMAGCVCYKMVVFLKGRNWTSVSRVLFTVIQWGIYIGVAGYTYYHEPSKYDFILFLFLAVAVTLTISRVCYDGIFNNKVSTWLGQYSFSLYLSHIFYRNNLPYVFPEGMSFSTKMCIYVPLSFATGLFVMYTSKGLKYLWKKHGPAVKKLFVRQEVTSDAE